jgi:hypothetical protein
MNKPLPRKTNIKHLLTNHLVDIMKDCLPYITNLTPLSCLIIVPGAVGNRPNGFSKLRPPQ